MVDGYYCYPLATHKVDIELHLFSSDYPVNLASVSQEIMGEVTTTPSSQRELQVVERGDRRRHAVCTVQTFCNPHSGIVITNYTIYSHSFTLIYIMFKINE